MQIGRRLYYDLTSGNVVLDTGERQGDVVQTTTAEDMSFYPQLAGRTTTNTGSVDYAFGDAKFSNGYATANINTTNQALTLYPWATIAANPSSIPADGSTASTITVTGLSSTDAVQFAVNGGTAQSITPSNGQAQITFTTQIAGTYTIQAQTVLNGTISATITAS